jgi:hypothetical protein
VTAGTIFQDTRKPLTVWFRAMWAVTSQKNGASAIGLQRVPPQSDQIFSAPDPRCCKAKRHRGICTVLEVLFREANCGKVELQLLPLEKKRTQALKRFGVN